MAGQRRGESRGHRGRGRAGARGLGLLFSLALILLAACDGDADGTDPFGPGRDRTGSSGGGSSAEVLVGTWRNLTVVQVPGDIQTWTTVWRFDADGICLQTVETESLAEGFPRTTERACEYTTAGGEITISYVGGGEVTFDFFFAAFSPDRLVLDGFEYDRLA
jgi:hypothetical protein